MSAGFTKGPWEAAERGGYSDFDGQSRVILGDDLRLAVVHSDGRPESEANALLIAAAPDLYGALLKWQAYDDQDEADFSQHGPMLLYAEAIEATRAALSKARGDQP